MSDDHRDYDGTQNCGGCRYWSELLAMADETGVKAMCLSSDSRFARTYTTRRQVCAQWAEGSLGAVDDPDWGDMVPYENEED